MTDELRARYMARAENLVAAFRQIAKCEHINIVAEATLALLAEVIANHPDRDEIVHHVRDHLATIVDQIVARATGGDHQGSA